MHKNNNFDLLRLLAALQVVVCHGVEHFHIEIHAGLPRELCNVLTAFPGVPIFFTISGFLIFWSFERNPDLSSYIVNRALRIFPALWCCFACTLALLCAFGVIQFNDLASPTLMAWFVAQVSVFQFYTPDLLRTFGSGTPNGSLWTIPVEIQFYVAVPLLFALLRKAGSKKIENIIFLVLMVASFAVNLYAQQLDSQSLGRKLMGVCLIPYLFYFLVGSIIYRNYATLRSWFEGRFLVWISVYALYFLVFGRLLGCYDATYWPNVFGLVAALLLSGATIAFAYSAPGLSQRLLRGNDLSYGVYIYHMPVINSLLELGYLNAHVGFLVSLPTTVFLAFLSWVLVEKPALAMKRRKPAPALPAPVLAQPALQNV